MRLCLPLSLSKSSDTFDIIFQTFTKTQYFWYHIPNFNHILYRAPWWDIILSIIGFGPTADTIHALNGNYDYLKSGRPIGLAALVQFRRMVKLYFFPFFNIKETLNYYFYIDWIYNKIITIKHTLHHSFTTSRNTYKSI